MKLEIPGQLRGSDTKQVIQVAIKIRKELENYFIKIQNTEVKTISIILRVGGEMGSFGDDGISDIKKEDGCIMCDLVLAPRQWTEMDEEDIHSLLLPKIMEAILMLLKFAGIKDVPEKLHRLKE